MTYQVRSKEKIHKSEILRKIQYKQIFAIVKLVSFCQNGDILSIHRLVHMF